MASTGSERQPAEAALERSQAGTRSPGEQVVRRAKEMSCSVWASATGTEWLAVRAAWVAARMPDVLLQVQLRVSCSHRWLAHLTRRLFRGPTKEHWTRLYVARVARGHRLQRFVVERVLFGTLMKRVRPERYGLLPTTKNEYANQIKSNQINVNQKQFQEMKNNVIRVRVCMSAPVAVCNGGRDHV